MEPRLSISFVTFAISSLSRYIKKEREKENMVKGELKVELPSDGLLKVSLPQEVMESPESNKTNTQRIINI